MAIAASQSIRRAGLTVAEVAAYCGVHRETVRRWIRSGELPAYKVGPFPHSPLRVRPDDLRRFLRPTHLED